MKESYKKREGFEQAFEMLSAVLQYMMVCVCGGCLKKYVHMHKNCTKKDARKDSSNFINLILEILPSNLPQTVLHFIFSFSTNMLFI